MKLAAIYWTLALTLAVCASSLATGGTPTTLPAVTSTEATLSMMPVPEPSRAAFLGAGIVAVAATYRRAWLNLSRRKS